MTCLLVGAAHCRLDRLRYSCRFGGTVADCLVGASSLQQTSVLGH